jgi:hypothetical protein
VTQKLQTNKEFNKKGKKKNPTGRANNRKCEWTIYHNINIRSKGIEMLSPCFRKSVAAKTSADGSPLWRYMNCHTTRKGRRSGGRHSDLLSTSFCGHWGCLPGSTPFSPLPPFVNAHHQSERSSLIFNPMSLPAHPAVVMSQLAVESGASTYIDPSTGYSVCSAPLHTWFNTIYSQYTKKF